MIYDHIVKCGGIYYDAGTDVPDKGSVPVSFDAEKKLTKPVETVQNTANSAPRRGRPPKK